MSLQIINADLHIHSCLSPCASLEMSPMKIVAQAKAKGLDAIAICDHNSAENTESTVKAGRKLGLKVFPGMEISTREEIHVLGIFETTVAVKEVQEVVYSNLEGLNREDYFGMQVIVNEYDDVVDFNPLFLAGATKLSFERTVDLIHNHGGAAVASHIDRQAFGLLGHFGYLPDDLEVDALEVTSKEKLDLVLRQLNPRNEKPLLFNSDAHYLKDIGSQSNRIMAQGREFKKVFSAITGENF